MTTRIGRIPYLNSEVFYNGMAAEADVELTPLVPRALSAAASDGGLDAGPVPLVTCFQLEDRFKPLGDFCIATVEKARSILLYSKRPIRRVERRRSGRHRRNLHLRPTYENPLRQTLPCKSPPIRSPLRRTYRRFPAHRRRSVEGIVAASPAIPTSTTWARNGISGRASPSSSPAGSSAATWRTAKSGGWSPSSPAPSKKGLADVDKIAASRQDLNMTSEEVIEYVRSFHYRLAPPELQSIQKFRHLLANASPSRWSLVNSRGA